MENPAKFRPRRSGARGSVRRNEASIDLVLGSSRQGQGIGCLSPGYTSADVERL